MREQRQPKGKLKLFTCGIALFGLLGCGPSQGEATRGAKDKPAAEELRLATHPGYVTPPGMRQECLGRLVFDVRPNMQWGINPPQGVVSSLFGFTDDMHGGHDAVHIGHLQMVVSAPAGIAELQDSLDSMGKKKGNAIYEYEQMIETDKRRIKGLSEVLEDPRKNVNNEDTSHWGESIERIKNDIKDMEASIANIQKNWHPIDLGIPNSKGYAAGPDLYAFLYHDGHLYKFLSASTDDASYEEREREFHDVLKRFQFRKPYEIPKQPGLCVPNGFLPDDGRTSFHTEVSIRYADRPGVIYTLNTGVVGEQGNPGPEATLFNATTRAASGIVAGYGARVQKSIGPRSTTIGALPADQGGISLNVADPGKPAVLNYSVYTGYGGWKGSHVLPYITVDMRSFTREQERTLKTNPPSFEESLTRLQGLLKSIRLRPTDPVMPELQSANLRN